ncbi:MAG: hypothetical protein ABR536_06680 [Solirubrobacterales bacterium]
MRIGEWEPIRANQVKGVVMTEQTKADRQAAAKKGAATRERNQVKSRSQEAGKNAAATRQKNEALAALDEAKSKAKGALSGLTSAGKLVGSAAVEAGKSAANRAGSVTKR